MQAAPCCIFQPHPLLCSRETPAPAPPQPQLFCKQATHIHTTLPLPSCSLCSEGLFPAPSAPHPQTSAAFFKAKVTFFLKSSLTLWAELIAPCSRPAQHFAADLYYSTATRGWDNLLICLCSKTVSSCRAETTAQIHFILFLHKASMHTGVH